jgi:hypothetical protein
VPPADQPATAAAAPALALRSFPFAAVDGARTADRKPRAERVPHKFRQLLEQAAESQGLAR